MLIAVHNNILLLLILLRILLQSNAVNFNLYDIKFIFVVLRKCSFILSSRSLLSSLPPSLSSFTRFSSEGCAELLPKDPVNKILQ